MFCVVFFALCPWSWHHVSNALALSDVHIYLHNSCHSILFRNHHAYVILSNGYEVTSPNLEGETVVLESIDLTSACLFNDFHTDTVYHYIYAIKIRLVYLDPVQNGYLDLSHFGLWTLYGIIKLGQHWLRWGHGAWRHQRVNVVLTIEPLFTSTSSAENIISRLLFWFKANYRNPLL